MKKKHFLNKIQHLLKIKISGNKDRRKFCKPISDIYKKPVANVRHLIVKGRKHSL